MKPRSLLPVLLALALPAAAAPQLVYLGTYANGGGKGIYSMRFDPDTGSCTDPVLAIATHDPSFLAFGPGEKSLYSVDEAGGVVNAFRVDPATGGLTFLNRQSAGGSSTAHLGIDPKGETLIAANYGSGTVVAYMLRPDGRLGPRTFFLPQTGPKGPNAVRQSSAHPHSVVFSPDGRYAYVCDLGLDRVFIYKIITRPPFVVRAQTPFVTVPPGSGPRHSAFSPDGKNYYVVDEMGGTVCVFDYDSMKGVPKLKQTVSTLPSDASGLNGSAEIAVHPSGRWVYASNRDVHGNGHGSDSLAVFSRDPGTGLLTRVEVVPCGGREPRNFAISPDGNWLICAHQDTDDLTVFRIDSDTGRLKRAGSNVHVPHPVCVLFYNPA